MEYKFEVSGPDKFCFTGKIMQGAKDSPKDAGKFYVKCDTYFAYQLRDKAHALDLMTMFASSESLLKLGIVDFVKTNNLTLTTW